jgi:phospholipase A1
MTISRRISRKPVHGGKKLFGIAVVLLLVGALAANAQQPVSMDTGNGPDKPATDGRSVQGTPGASGEPSYFTRLWELDEASRAGRRFINPHRTFYALCFSYNSSPNVAPFLEIDPEKTLTKAEVTFQLSFKTKLWEDVFGGNVDLWFGYTQRCFWQLYNVDDSSPFRETNYEPELLVNVRTRFSLLGFKARFITVGLNHQSNGQVEPVSRSWNRVVANIGLERGNLSILLKTWIRFPEADEDDDNPDITHYLGYGELWVHYFLEKHHFAVMFRNNVNFRENRGALQLEWSHPLFARVGIYAQYFLGYGESLIDYDHKISRVGVGFVLWE